MKQAIKIALVYVFFLSLYIAFSDQIALWTQSNKSIFKVSQIQIIEVIVFVITSGLIIYFIVKYYFKKLKNAIKNSNECQILSEKILASSEDGIGILDEFGKLRMNNASLLKILNFKKDKTHESIFISQIENAEIRTAINKFLTGQQEMQEFRFQLKKDTWIKFDLHRIKNFESKDIILLRCIDISDQVLKEDKLKEAERKFLSILQKVPFGILVIDDIEKAKYCNESFLDLVDAKPDELSYGGWLNGIHKEDKNTFKSLWKNAQATDTNFSTRCRFIESKNKAKWREVFSTSIYLDDQKSRLVIIRDISEQVLLENKIHDRSEELKSKVDKRTNESEQKTKRLVESQKALTFLLEDVNEFREDLEVSNNLLASANTELEAFSYSVSHDLRAPLRSINGFSQALMEDYHDKLDDEGLNYLDRICKGAIKMGELIDDMLILSRVSRREMRKQKINVSNMANEIVAELREAEPSRQIHCSIMEEITCQGDTNLIRILLTNLISNAWKFTGQSKESHIEVGKDEEGNIFIRDNGIGFNTKYVDKIFEPFQRLHSSNEYKGTGIGLTIVKRIIQRHDGEIRTESKEGEGTTFYFSIA